MLLAALLLCNFGCGTPFKVLIAFQHDAGFPPILFNATTFLLKKFLLNSTMVKLSRLSLIVLLLGCATMQAQEKPKWDVTNPGGNYKDVAFTVNEGTWMNVDVSPDGKEIIFDLLGDIYIMPAAGGEAKVLRQGLAFEVQPRFSPDGKKILFTSDAGGGDNIWAMNRDGSSAKQITK